MDPDTPGPTALCVTDPLARASVEGALEVPGSHVSKMVVLAHEEAKFFCRRCPVRRECDALAVVDERGIRADSRVGVRGGMGPGERAARDRHGRQEPTLPVSATTGVTDHERAVAA